MGLPRSIPSTQRNRKVTPGSPAPEAIATPFDATAGNDRVCRELDLTSEQWERPERRNAR